MRAVPYDVPQIGFGNDNVLSPALDVEIPEEHELDYPTIEARRRVQDITAILYPDDSSYEGKELRLIQEYFMTSAGLQTIIKSYLKQGRPLKDIHEKVSVHINDTHPAVAPAEFMRLLVDEYDLEWADAWNATVKTMSYTPIPFCLRPWKNGMQSFLRMSCRGFIRLSLKSTTAM